MPGTATGGGGKTPRPGGGDGGESPLPGTATDGGGQIPLPGGAGQQPEGGEFSLTNGGEGGGEFPLTNGSGQQSQTDGMEFPLLGDEYGEFSQPGGGKGGVEFPQPDGSGQQSQNGGGKGDEFPQVGTAVEGGPDYYLGGGAARSFPIQFSREYG